MRERLPLLDGWRGSAVLFMLVWHLFYDLAAFGLIAPEWMHSFAAVLVRYLIAGSFVFLAGVCCRLSRNNLRRGAILAVCAAAVTLAAWLFGSPIWFGILHFMACAVLLYALLGKRLERLPESAAAGICLALFAAGLLLTERVRVSVPGLWIIGLRTENFFSADYYPLVPWLFLFLAGSFVSPRLCESERVRTARVPRILTFLGRHALAVYLIHQPVLLGIMTLWKG